MSDAPDWTMHAEALHAAAAVRDVRPLAPRVSRHARLVLLDTLGCVFAGRTAPEVARLEAQLAELEPGSFRFPGGAPLGLRAACQILAIAPTWHEACEGHAFAHGRPGVPTIAALLPLALLRGVRVGEFIEALVTGYEVGARAGAWLRVAPGMHVDGNWPSLGVAAGVARLLRLPRPQARRAIDIAACQLPASLYLPVRTGRNVRNVYLAHSASLGLDSALAAQAGIDAPGDALAVYAANFCRPCADPLPPAPADLILDAYLKPFAAVRHVHYGAIAARRIREQLGGTTSGVTAIVLTVYDEARVYCNNPQPQTPLAAQFSLTFGVAAMLRFAALDPASYEEPRFHDSELRRLELMVGVRVDPDLTARGQRGATLRVSAGGRTLVERVADDDADLLLPAEDALHKFEQNAASAVTRESSRAFARALLEAEYGVPLRDLWQMLVPSPSHS